MHKRLSIKVKCVSFLCLVMKPCLLLIFESMLNMAFKFFSQDIDKAWKDLEQAEKDFQDWILSQLRKYVLFI